MKYTIAILVVIVIFVGGVVAQDPGWPREKTLKGTKLVYYQPQIDDWKNYQQLDARMAISLTPAGGKPVVGVVSLRANTDVDHDSHTVALTNFQITKTYFPSLDPAKAGQMEKLVKTFLPPTATHTIALERLVAGVEKSKKPPAAVPIKNDPPQIFVSNGPAMLVEVDGQPVKAPIQKTKLETIVNSNWPLFFDKSNSKYYMFAGKQWLTAGDLAAPWVPTSTLPKDMSKIKEDPNWADLKNFIPPPPGSAAQGPRVFYSSKPAEVLLFKGQPVYSKIPGTELVYATNTDSDVFVYSPTSTYYYLTAGRWFSAASLNGPWAFATTELPPDFAKIPISNPASKVLSSVPGTPEAEDAVLIAQIPHTAIVSPAEAAAKVKVSYYGEPQFKPIEGTSLNYAVNTPEKIVQVGDLYYLCFQGVWFMSKSPQGPWQTAQSVPQSIYTIPPSSPVYNVTYVTQTTTPSGSVESSYTAGYLGMFVTGAAVGAILASGTGYYYPPYVGWGYGAYPAYYPYAGTYGYHAFASPYYGAYGYGRGVYGPYGGASYGAAYNPYTGTYARGATAYGPYGSRSAAQAYNPYTGTYARGGSVSTPYGTRSAGQAYNPYTGASAATRQGSNAYSQWGSSVATRGNQAVATQHVSTAQGTVGAAQTSAGGRAVGSSTAYGNSVAGKTAGGDMYAGHDGNVYKNTGGSWQKYDNGGWNNVNTSADRPGGSSSARPVNTSTTQSLNQDFQNRQRGAAESDRFQSARSSGGFGGGGRSFGGGRRR